MAKYPIRVTLSNSKASAPKPAPKPQNRAAPPVTQAALNAQSRRQGLEASESLLLKRGRPDVIRTTVTERTTPPKKAK
jgi:hypothetical protein